MGVAATLPELSEWTLTFFLKVLITNAGPCGYFNAISENIENNNHSRIIYRNDNIARLVKVIRFDPLAPVKTTVLLLPIEWKMPDFINNIISLITGWTVYTEKY